MRGSSIAQAQDDPKLLKLMIDDNDRADDHYKPTNYWSVNARKFIPELQRVGLHDFRRRKNSVLSNFVATDLLPTLGQIDLSASRLLNNRITRKIPFWGKLLNAQNVFLNKILPVTGTHTIEDIEKLAYDFVRLYGERFGAKPVDSFEASLVGNPEDVIRAGEKVYTLTMLSYYLRYVFCQRFLDFSKVKVMVELGGGIGKQTEVIKKLYPDMCFLLFEIPPQSYVCEKYLSAVFPDSVISYRQTRDMVSLPQLAKGKIYIFGNWKFPILSSLAIDLFWNAASFQEMEPDVVENYLKYINKQAQNVFLQEVMDGKEVAARKGRPGVIRQTRLEDYRRGLADFELIDMALSLQPIPRAPKKYYDSFWRKK